MTPPPSAASSSTTKPPRRWQGPSKAMHAHFDLFSGAAGDMLLAACLDAAGHEDASLLEEITQRLTQGLPELAGEFRIHYKQVWRSKGSIGAKHVSVQSLYEHAAAPVPAQRDNEHEDLLHQSHCSHDHEHSHGHESSHSHGQEHAHQSNDRRDGKPHTETLGTASKTGHKPPTSSTSNSHAHSHEHSAVAAANSTTGPLRNLPQIRTMLQNADEQWIPAWVKTTAIQAFTDLAHAEATVHCAKSIDHVHFHEVGAVDSIIDTVGTLLGLYLLGATTFSCSPLPLGRGMVRTAHGVLPVPAPATLRLMLDLPTTRGPPGVTGELVTPTGAALIGTLIRSHAAPNTPPGEAPSSGMILRQIGVGAGTKDFDGHANILRVMLGELMMVPSFK